MRTWISRDWDPELKRDFRAWTTRHRGLTLVAQRLGCLALLLVPGTAPSLRGEDTVVLANAGEGRGQREVTGEVVEYTGRELILRRGNGKEERYPGQRVLDVRGVWNEAHAAAEQRIVEGRHGDALAMLQQALATEQRGWVRRRILARLVECYRETEQFDLAGDFFGLLLQSDPQTPYFDVVPLNWGQVRPGISVESKAAVWLQAKETPLRLLAGSWLLSTSRRAEATGVLRDLAAQADPRVAFLATAQLWRGELATAGAADVQSWRAVVERMPMELRAGPCFVLGTALARQNQADAAALYLLRVPILYPRHYRLSAEALWSAASLLEKQQQSREATTLYREITTRFAAAACAESARERLQSLDK